VLCRRLQFAAQVIAMDASPIAYDIPRASEAAGWSIRTTYNLIAAGKLRCRKLGTRTVIEAADLLRCIRGLPEGVRPELAPHRRGRRARRAAQASEPALFFPGSLEKVQKERELLG
jgi:hypothetical protein